MYHPIPRDWLLATNKIEVDFKSAHDSKTVHGSGFWIMGPVDLVLATNRHVVDIEYKDAKYVGCGYRLSSIRTLTFNAIGDKGTQVVRSARIFTHEDPGGGRRIVACVSRREPHSDFRSAGKHESYRRY